MRGIRYVCSYLRKGFKMANWGGQKYNSSKSYKEQMSKGGGGSRSKPSYKEQMSKPIQTSPMIPLTPTRQK